MKRKKYDRLLIVTSALEKKNFCVLPNIYYDEELDAMIVNAYETYNTTVSEFYIAFDEESNVVVHATWQILSSLMVHASTDITEWFK